MPDLLEKSGKIREFYFVWKLVTLDIVCLLSGGSTSGQEKAAALAVAGGRGLASGGRGVEVGGRELASGGSGAKAGGCGLASAGHGLAASGRGLASVRPGRTTRAAALNHSVIGRLHDVDAVDDDDDDDNEVPVGGHRQSSRSTRSASQPQPDTACKYRPIDTVGNYSLLVLVIVCAFND